MPRAEAKPPSTNYPYGSSYPSYSHGSPSPEPPGSPASQHSSTPSQSSTPANAASSKKKHVCAVCERPFSTSGHLARHSRVHTGERNHKCPFPGCETRCSRQDNLQQHYRIHLSPGSRRASSRTTMSRSTNNGKRGSVTAITTPPEPPVSPPPLSPPPLSQPPALEPARVYSHPSPPPDSPPPLAQATLPATAHAHLPSTSSSRSSASPVSPYPSSNDHIVSVPSQNTQQYSGYRNGTTTYHEPSQGSYPTFVHTTVSQTSNNSPHGSYNSYSNSYANYNSHTNSHHLHHANSASAPSSRHSISHISHPHSYPQNQHHSSHVEPPSPVSPHHPVSPHTSAPPTPPYAYDDSHGYHHNGNNSAMIADSQGHLSSQHNSMVHPGYSSSMVSQHQPQRYPSPSPVLPPIQDSRYPRRDSRPYLGHQQSPISADYSQYSSMNLSLGHRSWKDNGLHKDVGALPMVQ